MTYAVDGRQYVAVPVGWGGPVVPELADQPKAQTMDGVRAAFAVTANRATVVALHHH